MGAGVTSRPCSGDAPNHPMTVPFPFGGGRSGGLISDKRQGQLIREKDKSPNDIAQASPDQSHE